MSDSPDDTRLALRQRLVELQREMDNIDAQLAALPRPEGPRRPPTIMESLIQTAYGPKILEALSRELPLLYRITDTPVGSSYEKVVYKFRTGKDDADGGQHS